MVSGLSVGLLCPTREQTHLPLEKIHERARAPEAPCHRRRGTLCILLRIMLFSTLIRALNGHWVGQKSSPPAFRGPWHNAPAPPQAVWLRQRGRSAHRVEYWAPTDSPAHQPTALVSSPASMTARYILRLCLKKKKKVKIKAEKASITGPTVKLLESSFSLPSHGHETRAERTHGLRPSGTPRIHRWLIGQYTAPVQCRILGRT